MKRILIIIFIFAGLFSLSAQDVVLLNYNTLERKYEKSKEKIQDEKKGAKSKTWFKYGELMQDIYKLGLEYIGEGTGITELKLYYKEPESVQTEQDGPNEVKTLVYPDIKYVFVNDALSRWEKTNMIVEEPLDEAYDAYMKTLELDEKDKMKDDVKEQLVELKSQYMQDGINDYYNENLKDALSNFEKVLKINKLDMFEGVVDTVMIQYAGIIARELGEYKKAAEHYQELADLNFGGPSVYLNMKNDYLQMEDSTKAIKVMEEAFNKYTDTINVIANLIDLYIKTNNIEQGLEKINEAIGNNPDKGELYYWKGRLLLNAEDEDRIDKAIEVYETAIEKNPDLYYVYYDIGFIYFLQGQDIFSQAGLEQDTERRKEINDIATGKYKDALPLLEKAHDLNDTNMEIKCETLDVLKRIYYKLGMDDDYNRVVSEINNSNC